MVTVIDSAIDDDEDSLWYWMCGFAVGAGAALLGHALLSNRAKKQKEEQALDHTLEESFPASDPPSIP